MNPNENPNEAGLDPRLEKAIEEIRSEAIDPAVEERAKQSVWARLSEEAAEARPELIHGCADFRALIPDYVAGRLSQARALLLKDHTHECVACRKALEQATGRTKPKILAMPKRPAWLSGPVTKFAVAAALIMAVGFSAYQMYDRLLPASASTYEVLAADGPVYNVSGSGAAPLKVGTQLSGGAEIRTAKGSWASVRLPDGSMVELNGGSGFSISVTRRDLTINLSRGGIIVQAAKRRSGHLYVSTRDAKVAVTGTIFAVESGIKGSRVSVVEGEVHVGHNGREDVLHPGGQVVTAQSIAPVPVQDAIAWSHNVDKYLALLKEASALSNEFSAIRLPDLRYSSQLMKYAPADTVLYASVPNLAPAMAEAVDIFRRRTIENPDLKEWWDTKAANKERPSLDQMITTIRTAGDYVGSEVAVVAGPGAKGGIQAPVVLVELRRDGFQQFIESEMSKLGSSEHPSILFVNNAAQIPAEVTNQAVVLLKPGLAVMSPDMSALRKVAAVVDGQAPSFAGTPFEQYLSGLYKQGVGMLLATDIDAITAGQLAKAPEAGRAAIGNVRYLVVEHKQIGTNSQTRAAVTFDGPRTGIASWLADPGPIGALDFVSPDASFASAVIVQSPLSIVQDMFRWQESSNPNFRAGLSDMEAGLGINIEQDLAAQLGHEFAVAVDGPVLPKPSWKVAIEVHDAATLQAAIARLVERANQFLAAAGKPQLKLTEETVGGRTWYRLAMDGTGSLTEVDYTFVDGYLVAGANRPLIERAITNRAAGYTLARSEKFISIVPRDQYTGFSGMVYHNAGDTLGPILEGLSGSQALTEQQQQTVKEISSEMKPTVVTVYGNTNQVSIATNSNLVDISIRGILGLNGPLGLARSFGINPQHRKGEPARDAVRMKY